MDCMGNVTIDVRLFPAQKRNVSGNTRPKGLVTPGDVITTDTGFMRTVYIRFFLYCIASQYMAEALAKVLCCSCRRHWSSVARPLPQPSVWRSGHPGQQRLHWICPLPSEEGTKYVQSLDMVPEVTRDTIARVRNCVLALARHHVVVFDTSIVYAFEISLEHKVSALLKPEVMKEVATLTKQKLVQEA
ncbi:hypothetical protein HPB48_009363 [Haemaphysalis longicornis]|uniref:Uncharacterized protein n=1 Tax=Haemaphysalis longicornis TaxID=44386 RepID=A0A9J6FD74_HAELO|nr:hypothetical protein HPB48_009363 [Haemaphysalis longicornis]